ncbi:MAG: hypothetical protein P8L78_06570 [Mariniblastus sp.]|nr:hypothetical protein [Mariniblastus sp.]
MHLNSGNERPLLSLHMKTRYLFCWAILLLMASPNLFADDAENVPKTSRKVSDFRKDLKVFMKLSKSPDPQTERIAIYNLCQLHREIAFSPKFEESLQLQGMRVVISKRLTTFSADFANSLKRLARQKKKTSGDQERDSLDSTVPKESNSQPVLAENQATGETNPPSTGLASLENSIDEAELENAMWICAVSSYDSLNCVSGGPERIFSLIGGRLAPPWDHGQDLVDLITTVIHPNSWRNNGGNASIHYYQPSRVLVLHASLQGHHATSNLLEKLRGSSQTQLNITGGQGSIRN